MSLVVSKEGGYRAYCRYSSRGFFVSPHVFLLEIASYHLQFKTNCGFAVSIRSIEHLLQPLGHQNRKRLFVSAQYGHSEFMGALFWQPGLPWPSVQLDPQTTEVWREFQLMLSAYSILPLFQSRLFHSKVPLLNTELGRLFQNFMGDSSGSRKSS